MSRVCLETDLQGNLGKNQKSESRKRVGGVGVELKFRRAGRVQEKELSWDQTQTRHQQSWPSELPHL